MGLGDEQTAQGGLVPAAVEKGHVAAGAQRLPELLHHGVVVVRAHALLEEGARRLGIEPFGHVHARRAGVEVVEQVGDAAALAGAVPAFEEDHDADALVVGLLLEHREALDQGVVFGLVLVLADWRNVEIDLVEHGPFFPPARCRH